jgi:hypothetical protein
VRKGNSKASWYTAIQNDWQYYVRMLFNIRIELTNESIIIRNSKATLNFCLALFFWAPGFLSAQDPMFTARTSGNKVTQHSVFEVQFELQNANSNDFTPPSFKDFRVVGGPSVGSSTMIVNGKVSQSQSWSYSLLATKQGTFTIGAANVLAGRKKLSSRPITIIVGAPDQVHKQGAVSSSKEPVILKAEVDAQSYYPGQQIVLTYRLLFNENVQTVSTLMEDDYVDFFVQNFGDFSREATFESVNGVQYTSRILKSLALFAHQSGTYSIGPMQMSVGINAPFPGNQGFFNMRRIQDVQVTSQPLTITILHLPDGAPSSYSGGVGHYQMKTMAGQTSITTDDAFTFQLEITGDGDSRRWDPPVVVTDGVFEIYDPKITQDKIFESNNRVTNIRSIAYQVIPSAPGDFKVYVPFSFFDPERKEYLTICSDTMIVNVAQGQNKPRNPQDQEVISSEIPQLMKVHTVWLNDRFWVSFPHLFLFSLIVIGGGYGWWIDRKRKQEDKLSLPERLKAEAGNAARSQYDTLEASIESMPVKSFFEKVTEVYYKFLSDRFTIPPSELDESRLPVYLEKAGVSDIVAQRAIRFFSSCLSMRYGGTPGGFSPSEMLNECREIIGLLEA